MNPRRERFREAMARFEPTADPAGAIKDGLYVEPPAPTFAERTFRTIELRPRSSHLIAGASGIGKTTQLRVLERLLTTSGELIPVFIDVMAGKLDLDRSGTLLTLLAEQVGKHQYDGIPDDVKLLGNVAGLLLTLGGVNVPKSSPLATIKSIKKTVVLILDSLDRLPVEKFTALCLGDLEKLKGVISLVVVGPHAISYGAAREVTERFDKFSSQPTYDPRSGGPMHEFLAQVVRQRADDSLLPDESCGPLVEASGGIIRDLIALAQLSMEEAYVAGHNRVEPADASRAIDNFGRKHIIGLDSGEIAILKKVRRSGNFVRVNDRDTSLLVTRRVLEYVGEGGGTSHYVVHPTLVPLLEQLGDP